MSSQKIKTTEEVNMNNSTNNISEAFDILNNFESIAFNNVEVIPSIILDGAEQYLHDEVDIQLSRNNIEQLLLADPYLLTQLQEFGLEDHSPARFSLSHTAKRLAAVEKFISPLQTNDVSNAIAV
jgi:hypothetical protein